MKIISVIGARPNFIKIAPFIKAINKYNSLSFSPSTDRRDNNKVKAGVEVGTRELNDTVGRRINHLLVHTGQHYDYRMSSSFFESLGIPEADFNLAIGSGSHSEQVGKTMIKFEKILEKEKPDWVVVFGDVNATLACSLAAKKLNIKVCHIEAGLRSGDMSMPEEINRLVADRISDLLLTSNRLSMENLIKEGVAKEKIKFVGNIMIDTLDANRGKAATLNISEIIKKNSYSPIAFSLLRLNPYVVITIHRPSNVDKEEVLKPIVEFITDEIAQKINVVWSIHPRTRKMLKKFGIWEKLVDCKSLFLLYPIGYHEMLRLNMEASVMFTDSGGIQEECTILGTPCVTLRSNTERSITLSEHNGSSVLTGNNVNRIREGYKNALKRGGLQQRPELWDGNTAERCLESIVNAGF